MPSSRIQQANAAVEDGVDEYSDELDEELEDDNGGDDVDFGSRLPIPVSYNRTLAELYRRIPSGSFGLTSQSSSKTSGT